MNATEVRQGQEIRDALWRAGRKSGIVNGITRIFDYPFDIRPAAITFNAILTRCAAAELANAKFEEQNEQLRKDKATVQQNLTKVAGELGDKIAVLKKELATLKIERDNLDRLIPLDVKRSQAMLKEAKAEIATLKARVGRIEAEKQDAIEDLKAAHENEIRELLVKTGATLEEALDELSRVKGENNALREVEIPKAREEGRAEVRKQVAQSVGTGATV